MEWIEHLENLKNSLYGIEQNLRRIHPEAMTARGYMQMQHDFNAVVRVISSTLEELTEDEDDGRDDTGCGCQDCHRTGEE